tara:strand:+ start:139 stop:318 length:180 start_codon:yes stop_codon:yes gene_type:complete
MKEIKVKYTTKEHTTFLVKNIPIKLWKKLKMRNISENDENINDIMLKLINSYVKKGVNA